MSELQRVILLGGSESAAPAEVKEKIAHLFRLPADKVEQLFIKAPVVVKKDVSREVAEKLVAALEGCGARARFEPMPEEEAPSAVETSSSQIMTCPACGQNQPQGATCIFCGKVVAKVQDAIRRRQAEVEAERRPKAPAVVELNLRPMTVLDILAESFTMLREHALAFAGIIIAIPSGLVLACLAVFGLICYVMIKGGGYSLQPQAVALGAACLPSYPLPLLAVFLAGLSAIMFVVLWSQAGLTYAISESHLGHKIGVLSSYRFALGRMPSVYWTTLTTGLIIAGAMIILCLPALILGPAVRIAAWLAAMYLGLRYILVEKVVVLEGLTGSEARARCVELVSKNMLRLVGTVVALGLLTWLLLIVAGFAAGFTAGLIIGLLGLQLAELGLWFPVAFQLVVGVPAYAFAVAFPAIGLCLFYYDARLRTDGKVTFEGLTEQL
jgi:hypothetical protein